MESAQHQTPCHSSLHLPARGIQRRPCMYAKTSGGAGSRDNGSRSLASKMSVRSVGRERGRREGQGDGIRFLLSLLPLMVLRAHLLALSLPQSLLRPLPYSPQECYIPCLSRSLAGFTTQFEEPPYRAPSSTLLATEYSENSEATGADSTCQRNFYGILGMSTVL